MKVSEIKCGYLLKLRNGNLVGVYETADRGLCVSSKKDYFPIDCLNEETLLYTNGSIFGGEEYPDYDVMEVWGRTHPRGAWKFETEDRELLWKRGEGDAECETKCPVTVEEAAEATRELVDAMTEQGFTKSEAMAFLASLIVGGMAMGVGIDKD